MPAIRTLTSARTTGNAMVFAALLAVAFIAFFLMGMNFWHVRNLADPGWCTRALGAAKFADSTPEFAVGGCFNLLNGQLDSLAINSYITGGSLALCLVVLVVIVMAGGRLSFTAGKQGVSANMAREDAAQEVADAAQDQADEIKQ